MSKTEIMGSGSSQEARTDRRREWVLSSFPPVAVKPSV